jgi:urease accessory protein UreH
VRGGVTYLAAATAAGPLRVVRAEAGRLCDAVVVQTRGGLCDGDRWSLRVELDAGARVRLRGAGAVVMHSGTTGCRTHISAGPGAVLSWRSPGVIARRGVSGALVTVIDGAPRARIAVSEGLAGAERSELRSRVVVRRGERAIHEEWTFIGPAARAASRLGDATHLGAALAVGCDLVAPALDDRQGVLLASGRLRRGPALARALGGSLQEIDDVLGPMVERIHVTGRAR